MYYVYIVLCKDQTLYTGIATDLVRRINEHNHAKLGARYTASRRPVKLIYSKSFNNRSVATREEARIKKLKRSEKLDLVKRYRKYVQ